MELENHGVVFPVLIDLGYCRTDNKIGYYPVAVTGTDTGLSPGFN